MDYLVTADSYSGWIALNTLTLGTSSRMVIQKLKDHFSRFGVPDELYTDNGPQYSSWEFKQFSKEWGFIHKTSSPGFLKVMVLSKEQFKQPTECLTSASVMELILI